MLVKLRYIQLQILLAIVGDTTGIKIQEIDAVAGN